MNKYETIITQSRRDPQRSLTPLAFDMLSVLRFMWENREEDFIRLGNTEGSGILGCTTTQISRVIKELNKKGFIKVEWHGKGNEERRIYFNE